MADENKSSNIPDPDHIITEIKLFPTEKEGKTLAYANITLLDMFVVKNLRVVQGNKGVFIGMPSIKRRDGEHRDIFFPINTTARKMITKVLIDAYNEITQSNIQ